MKLHVGPKCRPKVEHWNNKDSETRLPAGGLMMKQDRNGCTRTRQNHPAREWLGFSWEAGGELPEGIHTSKKKMCKSKETQWCKCLQGGCLGPHSEFPHPFADAAELGNICSEDHYLSTISEPMPSRQLPGCHLVFHVLASSSLKEEQVPAKAHLHLICLIALLFTHLWVFVRQETGTHSALG